MTSYADTAREPTLQSLLAELGDVLTELGQKLEAGQAVTLDATALAALESITATLDAASKGKLDEIASSLAAILTELGQKLEAGQAVALDAAALAALESITIGTALPAGTNSIGTVQTKGGPTAYTAGAAAATVTVPAGARLRLVQILPTDGGQITVSIFGGATLTQATGYGFERDFGAGIPAVGTGSGAQIVIGGSVASYYVDWEA